VLLRWRFAIVPTGTILRISDVIGQRAVMTAITTGFASLLGVDASAVIVANVTDIATGTSVRLARRLGEAAPAARALAGVGSLGVSISMLVNLGKTPLQADIADQLSSLSTLAPQSALFASIVSAIAASGAAPASALATSVDASSVVFSNLPFLMAPSSAPAVIVAAGSGDSTGAIVGAVLGITAAFLAIWSWRSWAKHGKLPCCRDRGAEKRAALAAAVARNTQAAEGDLTVRTLASTVAELKAELAAKKALEVAERNREAGGGRGANAGVGMTLSPLAEARAKAVAESAVAAAAVEKRGFAPTSAH
jgi:hypothetical protein